MLHALFKLPAYNYIIIIHFILCAEICVDTAVTCTESGCTECKTGYVGLGCCDCAPGFSRDENDDCICKNMYINLKLCPNTRHANLLRNSIVHACMDSTCKCW